MGSRRGPEVCLRALLATGGLNLKKREPPNGVTERGSHMKKRKLSSYRRLCRELERWSRAALLFLLLLKVLVEIVRLILSH